MKGNISVERGPDWDTTDPTSPGYQMGSRKSEHQYGLIYDLLCEGEIGGLVNGLASIYLNNTPMANGTALAASGPRVGSSTTTANNASVTVKTGFSQGLSLTQGKRYINIMNAAATGAIDGALPIGSTTINTTTNIFTSDMDDDIILALGIKQSRTSILPRYVSIPNAGPGGATGRYLLLSYTDANTIEIFPGIHTAISSGNKIHVDYIGEITNISGTTLTVSPNVPRAVTHAPSQISQRLTNGGIADDFNFENVSGDFKTGARNQILPAQGAALGVPSASFTNAPNLDLQWTQGFTSRTLESSATLASGQQAPQIVNPTSASINLTAAQAREADSVRLVIEFPGGLIGRSSEGDEQLAYTTFQIFLRYKTKSTDSEYKKLLTVGPADPVAWVANGAASYRNNQNDGGGGTVTGKTNTAFVIEHVIDLTPVKPFDDWYIEIKRTTPSTQKDYVNGEAFPNDGFTGMSKLKFIEIMIMDKLSYPKSAYGIVNFSARDFPTPPSRAYHIRGKKIKVPSNYITREEINYGSPLSQEAKYTRNTTTGVDTGSYVNWDGNFRGDDSLAGTHINRFPVYCNNPAWVFYDLLTNKDYGLGQHLNAADIDKYSLYQIARYCDEMVPDGKGGLEPRFTANVYLSKVEEAYKVLKDMASIFRGMLIWMDGQLTPVQDRPKEPVYNFTTANVKDGLFTYEYTGTKARPNQVNVTYNDPEQNYKQTVLTVDDIDNIIETGKIVKKDTIAFGCTSAGQAQRLGHWVLKTDTLETELLSFTTSVGGGFLRPGDIINVQDRKLDSIDFGGRLTTGSTTTSIKLDRGVELQTGQSYEMYIFFPEPGAYLQQDAATINGTSLVRGDLILVDKDGNAVNTEEKAANLIDDSNNSVFTYYSNEGRLEKKSITTGAGTDISTIAVSSAFSSAPPSEIVWAISNVNDLRIDAPVKFRVLAVVEDDDRSWTISAVKYVEEKYDEIEKKFLLPQDQYKPTPDKNAEVPAPTGLRITMIPSAGIVGQSSGNEFITTVAWNSPVVAGSNPFYKYNAGYELLHFFEAEAHSKGTVVRLSAGQHSKTFTNVPSGTYTVKVRTVNTAGQVSKWTTVRQEVKPSEVPSSAFLRAGKLVFGGQVTSPAEITSGGEFKFTKANFRFVSPSKTFMDQSGTMTALDFSSLSNGQSAYVYFDASVPGFIAAQLHTDGVVKDAAGDVINATYWKTLGAANNGLSALSQGTVSTAIGSNVVTGNGTDFDTDFSVGDLIKVSTNSAPGTQLAGSEYNEIVSIISDTEMHCATNFTKAQTGYGFKQLFKPDFAGDCIAALIEKASDAYTYKAYATLTGEDGLEGVDGASVNFAFVRVPHGTTASNVTASTSGTSDTPANFTISSVTYTWNDNIPSGTGTLYTTKGTKAAGGTQFTWGTPRQLEGDNHAEVIIYSDIVASGGSAPSDPTGCTYNFTNGTLTIAGTNASSWNKTPPSLASAANGSQIFAITVVVSGAPGDTSASIAASDWSAAFVHARHEKGADGEDGDAGPKVAELELYYKISGWTYGSNANWPSTPSTGTYNFATDTLSNIPSGWSRTKSTTKGSLNSISRALVTESSTENVSNSITWGTPSFSDEGVGDTNFIFKYMSSAGSAPGGTSYPNIPSGWSDSIPNNPNDGTKLFSSKGTAALSGSGTNFQFNYTWQTPVLHVQDKADISLGSVENKSSASIRSEIDANDLAGSGKAFSTLPESGATVGATVGTNFFKPGTTTNYNTNEFQNEDLAISAGSNGVFTLNRGASSTTTTITKANLGLNYTDGADITSANTSADTAKVNGVVASTISGGADRANNAIDSSYRITGSLYNGSTARTISDILGARDRAYAGLDSNGDVARTVPTNRYTNTTYSNLSEVNSTEGTKLAGIAAGADVTANNTAADTANVDGTSAATVKAGAAAGATANQDTTAAIRAGVISMVTEGSTTHSWSITGDNVFPSGSTQVTTFKWFAGDSSTPLKQATVTSTVDTDDRDLSSITWSGVSSGVSGTVNYTNTEFQQVEASYNGLRGKVTCIVTDMEGWSFSKG